jgi:uncharacterized membrane protein YhaH (DUF805 family)
VRKQAEAVGPFDALKNWFRYYARFSGRSSRSEYWWMALWGTLFNVGVFLPVLLFGSASQWLGEILLNVFLISQLGVIIPTLALSARRLTDAGFSPFWLFLLLSGLFGSIPIWIMCAMRTKPEPENLEPSQE